MQKDEKWAKSHLKASAPKLKHGAMAVRLLMILKGEIAFEQIGNGDRQRPCAPLASANVPQRLLPKNSPKRSREQAHRR
jgi:hypothetical protein